MVEPEVVATSPNRFKRPVPVYCGFGSMKWWAREDLHLQGSQNLDLRGLLFPLNHSPEKLKWSLQPVLPRQNLFTKEVHRLLHGGELAGMQKPRSLRCCPGHGGLMKPT